MNLAKAIRSRREHARNRRALSRALHGASPNVRDELIAAAQRSGVRLPPQMW